MLRLACDTFLILNNMANQLGQLYQSNQYAASVIGGVVIFVLRVLATKYKWDLTKVE